MEYDCIGICTPDPDSGLCQGCGRPLADPLGNKDEAVMPDLPQASESVPCN